MYMGTSLLLASSSLQSAPLPLSPRHPPHSGGHHHSLLLSPSLLRWVQPLSSWYPPYNGGHHTSHTLAEERGCGWGRRWAATVNPRLGRVVQDHTPAHGRTVCHVPALRESIRSQSQGACGDSHVEFRRAGGYVGGGVLDQCGECYGGCRIGRRPGEPGKQPPTSLGQPHAVLLEWGWGKQVLKNLS